ncbi:MAG: outer membrane lipoprotein carrier protein LolA, partial [Myxococcaceae bacterium]|nr:outer membrane lipoprotein carrier protein LolA [Myxococcaceae bacterium]
MAFDALLMALLTLSPVGAEARSDAGASGPVTPSLSQGEKTGARPLAPDVQALVDRMQRFYESTADFTADFQQEYTYKAFRRKQSSRGKVTFKKPGMMRWEYTEPSPRTFVLAANKVYAYDPEARTLTVGGLDTSQ